MIPQRTVGITVGDRYNRLGMGIEYLLLNNFKMNEQ